uniref:Uncharacterized protein n=1 Tax=Arundo donax TaxID=35708 RepID=A0A0A8XWT1_ARUDO
MANSAIFFGGVAGGRGEVVEAHGPLRRARCRGSWRSGAMSFPPSDPEQMVGRCGSKAATCWDGMRICASARVRGRIWGTREAVADSVSADLALSQHGGDAHDGSGRRRRLLPPSTASGVESLNSGGAVSGSVFFLRRIGQ